MKDWTTRLDPKLTRPFGVEELHDVCFVPMGWPGKGPTIGLGIPECETMFTILAKDGTPITEINRPPTNHDVKRWTRMVCKTALGIVDCCVMFNCDTVEQAEQAARRATKWLPGYKRMPLERMYRAETRADGGLN
jgi:hypothetical protein